MTTWTDEFSGSSTVILELVVTTKSQNITNNTSVVEWSLRMYETANHPLTYSGISSDNEYEVVINGTTYSGNYTFDLRPSGNQSKTLRTGTTTVSHNADGTKTIVVRGNTSTIVSIGSASITNKNYTIATIPRASVPTVSANPSNIGSPVTITTNRASGSFTHDITYSFAGATGTVGTGVGASVAWTPPLSLLNQIPNSVSSTCTLTTVTKSGSTVIGSKTTSFTLQAASDVVPDFTSVTHSENVSAVSTAVGAYVQNKSKLNLAITGAVEAYGSPITAYQITVDGLTVSSASGVSGFLPQSGSRTVTGTITDARGRKKTKTTTITVLAYTSPMISSGSVFRANSDGSPNPEGTYIRVNFAASVSSLVNGTQKNALRYRVRTRLKGSPTWNSPGWTTPGGLTFDSGVTLTGFSASDSWEVRLEVTDVLDTVTPLERSISTAAVAMHWDKTGGVGIGKFHESGALDVAGNVVHQRNGISSVMEPSGIIQIWPVVAPPAGWLICNGQAVSRTTYAALFSVLGTTYGVGDGSTTFNLPNLKGRVPVGYDTEQTEFNAMGETGGAKTHTLTAGEMPSHTHTQNSHVHPAYDNYNFAMLEIGVNGVINTTARNMPSAGGETHYFMYASGGAGGFTEQRNTNPTTAVNQNTGGGGAHNNLQPYIALNYIIKI